MPDMDETELRKADALISQADSERPSTPGSFHHGRTEHLQGELEIDHDRGVIYFHAYERSVVRRYGQVTLLRVSGLGKIPDDKFVDIRAPRADYACYCGFRGSMDSVSGHVAGFQGVNDTKTHGLDLSEDTFGASS